MLNLLNTQFTIKRSDIPQEVFKAAESEATAIYESSYISNHSLSGRPRRYEDVLKDTMLGKLGEYLIKFHFNYTEDNAKYHDLISPSGERTEIKTWRKKYITRSGTDREIQKLRNKRRSIPPWFFSTKVIIMSYDEDSNVFTIEEIHDL